MLQVQSVGRFLSWAFFVATVGSTGGIASAQQISNVASRDVEADGTTALHRAVNRDDLTAVDRLLKEGADANTATRLGVTPLWLAASNGNARIIVRLLQAGANANAKNPENDETVLMMAARSGSTEAVSALLASGAEVNATERLRNQTALMWAAAQKHPDVVKVLLRSGATVKVKSTTGLTPLLFAIRAGDIESTRLLLDAGADLTENYSDGTTPLVVAIINVHYELAALLLDRGADPNGVDPSGPPLSVLTTMRKTRGYYAPSRAQSGNLDSIGLAKSLLAHGADINVRIDWKDKPPPSVLGSTAGSGITYGKYIPTTPFNFVSFVGATPFCLAAFNMDAPFMRFLAANGADPSIPTAQNVTPLLAAAGVGYRSAFLNNDADVMEAVQAAYELGNDPKAVVDFSNHDFGDWRWNRANALHGAAARGNLALIKWLADKGVSFEQRTEGRWLPVDAADGIWNTGFAQHQFAAATLIRELMAERGLPVPQPRAAAEVENDGKDRNAMNGSR